MSQTKIMVAIAGGFALVMVVIFFVAKPGSNKANLPQYAVGATAERAIGTTDKPNAVGVPANYEEQTKEFEITKADAQLKEGGSHASKQVGANFEDSKPVPVPSDNPEPARPTAQAQQPGQAQVDQRQLDALMASFKSQMDDILVRQGPGAPTMLGAAYPSPEKNPAAAQAQAVLASASAGAANGNQSKTPAKVVLIRAGTIEAITADTGANSETGGTVRATLQSGPYRGSHILGKIKTGDDGGLLQFTTLVTPGGTAKVNAVAMTVDATSVEVADRVDSKFFERFVLRPMGAVATAIAAAIPAKQQTVTISGTSGISQSSGGMSTSDVAAVGVARGLQAVAQSAMTADTKPVAYIDPANKSGQMKSVMFLEDVVLDPK